MTREQFIEKWGDSVSIEFEFDSNGEFIGSGYNEEKEKQFISDLNSLFTTRSEEEVREELAKHDKVIKYTQNTSERLFHQGLKDLCKWFLKETP